jgi:para-aminobenzoate synthetase component I
MKFPINIEIPYQDPSDLLAQFLDLPFLLFLDSASTIAHLGRYSFITADPFHIVSAKNQNIICDGKTINETNPFNFLETLLEKYSLPTQSDLPPFQGGAAGLFSYDLVYHLEKIPKAKYDDLDFPDMLIGFYDCVIAFDHHTKKAWIISSGFPKKNDTDRVEHAEQRIQFFLNRISNSIKIKTSQEIIPESTLTTHFTKESYKYIINKAIDYIYAGDIFEVNISQRFHFELPPTLKKYELYLRLHHVNPAPFSAYFDTGTFTICSASPERFIKLENKMVETRPIKGTRPRSPNEKIDAQLATDLMNSPKDRAENIMIVDLMRNDLSRVCLDESITVKQLCGLETYATVHHLVSSIEAELQTGKNAIDLLKSTFPGGSVTGVPKIRAMEIIYELEPVQRGPYCGSIGYIGFNGTMDTSILIRTFAIHNNFVTVQVGGAILSHSIPENEYNETLHKLFGMRKTLEKTTIL